MRVVIIWRDESEYGRSVTEWLREVEHRTSRTLESYSPDEPEGESICRTYGVTMYPTILAIDRDGKLLQEWRGEMLPRIDDVSYYLSNDQ